MASDNRAYTQFEDTHIPPTHYGTTTPPAIGHELADTFDSKTPKKWKNSKRLCWAMLATSIATLILETIGAIVSSVHLDWLLVRFLAGVWLAALGVISAGLGLGAFKNPFQSGRCLTLSHFAMTIVAIVAYGILFIMAAGDLYRSRESLEAFHDYFDEIVHDAKTQDIIQDFNDTSIANATLATGMTTIDYDAAAVPLLNAIKGDLAVSVFLLGTILAFLTTSVLASVVICRHWCLGSQKAMTIVYMAQDASGNAHPQSVVVPSKAQVVVVPAPKTGTA